MHASRAGQNVSEATYRYSCYYKSTNIATLIK